MHIANELTKGVSYLTAEELEEEFASCHSLSSELYLVYSETQNSSALAYINGLGLCLFTFTHFLVLFLESNKMLNVFKLAVRAF